MPLVSIGLPVFNGEKYINQALESLLNQTFRNIEIIVSDNFSNDNTVKVVERYQIKDSRIKLFKQVKNIGISDNYLFVLNKSNGKYFMWAAHDDLWADNWVEQLINNISERDVGIRGLIRLDKQGSEAIDKKPPSFKKNQFVSCFMRNETDYRSHYFYSLFYREKLLLCDFTLFYLDYYCDAIFVYDLLKYGDFRTVSVTHQVYRVHEFNAGEKFAAKWRGVAKMLYRVHPFIYYKYYLIYSKNILWQSIIFILIPLKHVYAQVSFWLRGLKEILTGRKYQ